MGNLRRCAIVWGVMGCAGGLSSAPGFAAPADSIFTVGNYPVEARAKDAVAAKDKALADGQKAALRSLIKRLVPVTSYGRLRKLDLSAAASMVDGVQVRSERNSATEYIANLDFSFQPQAVRSLLQREGLQFVETQARTIALVPVWNAQPEANNLPPAFGATLGSQGWADAWKALDLQHTLTPATLETAKLTPSAETAKSLADGDPASLQSAFGAALAVAVIATPDPATKRLAVTVIGRDAVGPIFWRRTYRVDATDPVYSLELAAVVSLGVIEGRWKAVNARGGGSAGSPGLSASARTSDAAGAIDADAIELAVEFRGMSEWQGPKGCPGWRTGWSSSPPCSSCVPISRCARSRTGATRSWPARPAGSCSSPGRRTACCS